MKPDLAAIRKRLEVATLGPWKYGGTIGDPGRPLRHYVKNGAGRINLLSEEFAVDYAGLEKDLIFSAHARTDITALLEYVGELERTKDALELLNDAVRLEFKSRGIISLVRLNDSLKFAEQTLNTLEAPALKGEEDDQG